MNYAMYKLESSFNFMIGVPLKNGIHSLPAFLFT